MKYFNNRYVVVIVGLEQGLLVCRAKMVCGVWGNFRERQGEAKSSSDSSFVSSDWNSLRWEGGKGAYINEMTFEKTCINIFSKMTIMPVFGDYA